MTVLPGAGAYWFEGNDVGCLLVHGFTGTPQNVRPLADYLARRGLAVSAPRMPGHGTTVADLDRTGPEDWLGAAEHALTELRERCSTVFVAGISLGGTLTLELARRHPHRAGVVVRAATNTVEQRPQLGQRMLGGPEPVLRPGPVEVGDRGAVSGHARRRHRQPAAGQVVRERPHVLRSAGEPVHQQAADVVALEPVRARTRQDRHQFLLARARPPTRAVRSMSMSPPRCEQNTAVLGSILRRSCDTTPAAHRRPPTPLPPRG